MTIKIITLMGASLALVSASTAATLTFVGTDTSKSKAVSITYKGKTTNVMAGVMNFRLDGGEIFEAFCIDLDNWNFKNDQYGVNVTNTTILPQHGSMVESLFANYAAGIGSKDEGAALQLAIWDALVDGGDGLDSGNFKANVNSGMKNLVSSMLTAQESNIENFTFTYFEAISHTAGNKDNRYQNVFTGEAVPEPATMAIFGIGSLIALRKRNKAKA